MKFVFPVLALTSTGLTTYLTTKDITNPPIQSLDLSEPRSFKLADGALVSCDAVNPADPTGSAASFIAQRKTDDSLTTTIMTISGKNESVAIIYALPIGFIYRHILTPDEANSPTVIISGVYDQHRNQYKIKDPGSDQRIPVATDWRANMKLTRTLCAQTTISSTGVTLIESVKAYPSEKLTDIDKKLQFMLTYRTAISPDEATRQLGLPAQHLPTVLIARSSQQPH